MCDECVLLDNQKGLDGTGPLNALGHGETSLVYMCPSTDILEVKYSEDIMERQIIER